MRATLYLVTGARRAPVATGEVPHPGLDRLTSACLVLHDLHALGGNGGWELELEPDPEPDLEGVDEDDGAERRAEAIARSMAFLDAIEAPAALAAHDALGRATLHYLLALENRGVRRTEALSQAIACVVMAYGAG